MRRFALIAAVAAVLAAPAAAQDKPRGDKPAECRVSYYVVVCGPGKSPCRLTLVVVDCRQR